MARSLTTKNLLEKKPGKPITLSHPELLRAIGVPECKGCWLVYGAEKNGKTWFTLTLAKDIARGEKVAYVSAEEGTDESFRQACQRAGITTADRIVWDEYMSIDDIIAKFKRPKTPAVVVVDNLTMYADELKPSELKKRLVEALPNKLFIFVAHEERKEAYPALARMAKKMAKVVIRVQGLKATITSRFAKGGELVIDEEKSALYWGEKTEE